MAGVRMVAQVLEQHLQKQGERKLHVVFDERDEMLSGSL